MPVEKPVQEAAVVCAQCGETIPDDTQPCPNCGYVKPPPPPPTSWPPRE